jgi:hypothetical protein
MLVHVATDNTVSLQDAENFRAFKLVIEGGDGRLEAARAALAGVAELPDNATAWVSASALRAMRADDAAWQASLAAMVEKARPHGWVHPDTGAIRAHVEFA